MLYGYGAIGLLLLGLWIFCIVDVITSNESDVRYLPKIVWLLIVILLSTVGSVVWLLVGRPRAGIASAGAQRSVNPSRFPEYDRPGRHIPANPDDDEEFLRRCRERAEEQRRAAERKRKTEDQDGAG